MNSAENLIKEINNPILDAYKDSLHRENMYQIFPFYGFLSQDLSDEYDLDYQKWGLQISKNIKDGNGNITYRMINYSNSNNVYANCLTNSIKISYNQHINPSFEYGASISGKFYERNGKPLLLGDGWVKYKINDNLNLKSGLSRETVEQSFITAVGDFVDGEFIGRATINRVFFETNIQLKKNYYASIRGNAGFVQGNNIPNNWGYSAYLNIGKRLYNNPHNKFLQKIDADLTTYNLGYNKNLLEIYTPLGTEVGGYFSPSYYNATAANIRFEGEYKKLNYGLKGFIGEQISTDGGDMSVTFGVSPYLRIKINNRLYFKITYTLAEFADIKSNLFAVGFVIRL
jgi:hypothetical protein